MKQILNFLTKKTTKNFFFYALGLILNKENKTCTKMANFFGINHERLYGILNKANIFLPLFPSLMLSIASYFSRDTSGWLIIDDTTMSKPFIKFLAGVYTIYNTALGRPDRGFNLVIIAWSNGKVTIPLQFEWYFHKDIIGKDYKTKTEVGIPLIKYCLGKIPFRYVLFDAHYATINMLKFLYPMRIRFVAKIPRNRKVTTKKRKFDRLQALKQLKLIRNERSKRIIADYHGMQLYFSVHKRKNKNNDYTYIYIVSNIDIYPKAYCEIYSQRWDIEEMFRTMKQLLGFADCQSTDLEKQRSHIFFIFFSYSFLESEKHKNSLDNPEAAEKLLRKIKLDAAMLRITSFSENFQCFA